MNQNGFLKPKIKTSFELIWSLLGSVNLMNTAHTHHKATSAANMTPNFKAFNPSDWQPLHFVVSPAE